MKKQILALDLDDTLSNNMVRFVEVYNRESGDTLKYEDLTAWEITDFVRDDWKDKVLDIFDRKGWWYENEPRQDMQAAVAMLAVKYEILVVTAYRGTEHHCYEKFKWVRKHFPSIKAENIIFCSNKSMIHCSVLVDDGLHNLESTHGVPVVMSRPWNLGVDTTKAGRHMHRVSDGYELYDLLVGLHTF